MRLKNIPIVQLLIVPLLLACLPSIVSAQGITNEPDLSASRSKDICLLELLKQVSPDTTVAQLEEKCDLLLSEQDISSVVVTDDDFGTLELREVVEEASMNTPFILTAHRANYLLPAVYVQEPNNAPFDSVWGPDTLKNTEVQFQISLKAPVVNGLFFNDDSLWVGYTMRAFWQAYNADVSRPFRDTNHEPEIMWQTQSSLALLGLKNMSNQVALNHQSNGRAGTLSRSWNRLMLHSSWERKKLSLTATYWERLNEDPATDENPQIETYVGNVQLLTSYAFNDDHRTTLMLRGNPEKGKGAAELTWSFPLFGSQKIKGMAKYFDGYGESLLDYNVRTRSFGLGFMVTDWF